MGEGPMATRYAFRNRALRWVLAAATLALVACGTLPSGAGTARQASTAFAAPQTTRLGSLALVHLHDGDGRSGFRLISVGVDGFVLRMQLIEAAQRSLDLQYFIFHGDETGRLITGALLRAADRGVRVRILVDDGETSTGDEQLTQLEAHPSIFLRIFNPFRYRGHSNLLRAAEFALAAGRLDYRMHNKLMVADNAVAVIGGRNIGDQYFQVAPSGQFADDDVVTAGPVVGALSATFDEFWNSELAIPAEALAGGKATHAQLRQDRAELGAQARAAKEGGIDYVARIATGRPLQAILTGELPLLWAPVRLVADSPDKRATEDGRSVGRLMQRPVLKTMLQVHAELLMVTPYLVPGAEGMQVLDALRQRGVRVRILTNSLESSTEPLAQAVYTRYRPPLLEDGVELYEVRAQPGLARGSGQSQAMSRNGNYSLHAKMFVFDREQVFLGSMNFDRRSMHLNTEIGLIIDSPELAAQIVGRFEEMVKPENAYRPVLRPTAEPGQFRLAWEATKDGIAVEYCREPARSAWQRFASGLLSWLPIDREL